MKKRDFKNTPHTLLRLMRGNDRQMTGDICVKIHGTSEGVITEQSAKRCDKRRSRRTLPSKDTKISFNMRRSA